MPAFKIFMTLFTVVLFGAFEWVVNIPATLATGKVAGSQFDPSDSAYIVTQGTFAFVHIVNIVITAMFVVCLIFIWFNTIRDGIKWLITTMGVVLLFIALAPTPSYAYYDQTDYAEPYFILPNESAFWIPDVGENKQSQAAFGSVDYYKENKIAAKRFTVPHAKLTGSSYWSNYYVPSGRLIIVDRTPYAREWTAPGRGTNPHADESMPCQTGEGLDFRVGVTIAAFVKEENAPTFLYSFGVNPPQGDRTDPKVIFTSVMYGKSLTQVMDTLVRARVQSLVCDQVMQRTMTKANEEMTKMMATISETVTADLAKRGITLDFIGWGDTVHFGDKLQDAIDRKFIADRDAEIAKLLAGNTDTIQKIATAEATRTLAGKWNGSLPASVSLWWLPSGLSDWLSTWSKK